MWDACRAPLALPERAKQLPSNPQGLPRAPPGRGSVSLPSHTFLLLCSLFLFLTHPFKEIFELLFLVVLASSGLFFFCLCSSLSKINLPPGVLMSTSPQCLHHDLCVFRWLGSAASVGRYFSNWACL